jgi:hypothetical protein
MNRTTRDRIRRYLEAFDFAGLFTDPDLGWDWPESKGKLRVPTKTGFIDTEVIADKRGVKVLHLAGLANGEIPASDERKAIEKAVTPLATEHLLIFTDKAKTRQVWLWTSRFPGKPMSYRELTWEKGKSNELLLQKLASIAFTISEEESLDITGVVERLRDSLDRDKVTKRFYDQFKTQKDEFRKFIKGISDSGLWDWYTSLMLNRLMFCYFLQRKGFLDGDLNYLSNRLDRVRDEFGKGKFHSFYKTFLRRLFHEGLGAPKNERADDLKNLVGDVPYLNGGIFEEHKIERDHPTIHIPDEAFEKIFSFLDQFDWHLDDRPIAKGNEINPEILGYVFEKYTNQKEMGAYYTKEDITDYIAKNCIIPFLLDAAGDKLGAASWNLLGEDPDRYIYPAVGHGVFCDYPTNTKLDGPLPLPDYIERGIDTLKPDLRKRRSRWNESADPDLGLPTENWRETVTRRQRCEELQRKLRAGEVHAINDFITLNLNIRQFAQDVVENAAPDLLLAFFKAMRKLSVLDPTCGSGAFLFAALNVLEPLYRASLDRMRALLGDWETRGDKTHPNYRKEFSTVLDQATRHPNESYFIFKSIIVHNLYGVDIMEEAVEICKLRLFLKLAAQLEPGQEIEPLPDIDFNIRAGNTLVGYASRDEVQRCMTQFGDGQMRLGVEDELQSYSRVEEAAQNVDKAFELFQQMQDDYGMDAADFRKHKGVLFERLQTLRSQLDRFLAADYNKRNVESDSVFEKWRVSHHPFHWFVEFHGILSSGGFDSIIGNPPYVELLKVKSYDLRDFATLSCGNLYALMVERSLSLISSAGSVGLIVPLSLVCTARTAAVRSLVRLRQSWIASFDMRPNSLFEGVAQRLCIFLNRSRQKSAPQLLTAGYRRWAGAARSALLALTEYRAATDTGADAAIAKFESVHEPSIRKKISGQRLESFAQANEQPLYVHRIVRYFVKALDFLPLFREANGMQGKSEDYKLFGFQRSEQVAISAALNSTLFYWFWRAHSDGFHCGYQDVYSFPWTRLTHDGTRAQLAELQQDLMVGLRQNSSRKKIKTKAGIIEYQEFYPKNCKEAADRIDAVLAKHYGFTEEELDFIINYDIKYRMGLTASVSEDGEA